MAKPFERAEARRLRGTGMSVKDIACQLGVTKGSVSVWVRDIDLTDVQKAALKDKYHHYDAKLKGSQANYQSGLDKRLAYQQEGRAKAREGDPLHMAGCMLYWAEGSKARNSLRFVNSDPDMLKFYVRFLRGGLNVDDQAIAVHINCYLDNGFSLNEIECYWLNVLSLRAANLRKAMVNQQPIHSQQRGRKLMYGVCGLLVHQTRAVQHVLGAIQEYIGIDKPEWLL